MKINDNFHKKVRYYLLMKKMSYANKLGIENVILVGEDEVLKNKVRIKNMKLGNEIEINYEDL